MTAKPEPCAYCGKPLAASRLQVTSDTTGGPTGGFCLSTLCYVEAVKAAMAALGRQIPPAVRGKASGATSAPQIEIVSPGEDLGPFQL